MIELSVVIPTYNRLDTLRHVLEGFQSQTLDAGRFEVIVVDSMSGDGTEQFMETLKPRFPLRYIRQENRGRPGARNRGIQEAKSPIVFFTDSDIIPENDLLEKHLAFHRDNPNSAGIGWESRIDAIDELHAAKANPDARFKIHPHDRRKLTWLYFLTGNASAPRQALLDAGMFDEAFQGYGFEDLELGYRLFKAGIQIRYLPDAVNYHLHPRSLETKYEVQELAGKNAVYFYRKHGDWRIRWQLGMSPPAFWWHAILRGAPALRRFMEKKAADGRSRFCEEVLIQYHYLLGVRDAWTPQR